MDELDLLKKHWNQHQEFPKINKDGIRQMLHKSSSSIVKWIFIVCCLELCLFIGLTIFLPTEKERFEIFQVIDLLFEICSYGIVLYFLWTFYKHMNEIKSTQNTKALIENILQVRKSAEKYIQLNLMLMNLVIGTALLSVLYEKWYDQAQANMTFYSSIIILIIVLGVFAWLLNKLIKGYYHLIYGLLLKKLNKNYEELIKLEE